MTTHNDEECCPPFDLQPWQHKTHTWKEKRFIKDTVPEFFHTPLPWMVKKVMMRMWGKAQAAEAAPDMKDFLLLAYDPSPWKGEFYLSVTEEVSEAENVRLSGTFISKIFDGPYNRIPKYIKEMEQYLRGLGKESKKYYFYYTTCPKCAKKYGHNYIVAFSEV